LPAVRIATSPVPPCPLWQAVTMAVSIGYIRSQPPTKNSVVMIATTVETEHENQANQHDHQKNHYIKKIISTACPLWVKSGHSLE
jgi:hypothetical protein